MNKGTGLYKYALGLTLLVLLNGCSSRPSPAPVTDAGTGTLLKKSSAEEYRVQPGDTLFSIAWWQGKDPKVLAELNNISPPYKIFAGQLLRLKGKPKSVASTTTGQTTKINKINPKPPVDPPSRQEYVGGEETTKLKRKVVSDFPANVGKWRWPTKGNIIGRFSLKDEGNKGIDIAGQRGTPISAAADGKVVYTGDALKGYGNLIIIKHSETYLSAYAHNDAILVKEQQWVRQGQSIARMGNSGAQRNMLHFEIRYKGKSVDPLRYLPKTQ